MTSAHQSRGRPLVALILLLVVWAGFRTAFWDNAAISAVRVPGVANTHPREGMHSATVRTGQLAAGPQSVPGEGFFAFDAESQASLAPEGGNPAHRMWQGQPLRQPVQEFRRRVLPRDYPSEPLRWRLGNSLTAPPPAPAPYPGAAPADRPVPVRVAVAHQMLWMAAVSRMPLPMDLFANVSEGRPASPYPSGSGTSGARRWSADSWLLLRRGGNVSLASGLLPATYGASQMGAVLRYRLAPRSGHRPAAYLRTTAALNGSKEKEAVFGVSARPIASFPLAVAAEVRAADRPESRQVRPAVLAWTEIAPFELPFGTSGEFYAQGGYVGGKFKTPFADGQLRVDRSLTRFGRGDLRAGGGAWAGAQKGASRVDVGPTATMGMPISGSASARVGVDWRFRVTGNAEPKSGPAFTVSAGF